MPQNVSFSPSIAQYIEVASQNKKGTVVLDTQNNQGTLRNTATAKSRVIAWLRTLGGKLGFKSTTKPLQEQQRLATKHFVHVLRNHYGETIAKDAISVNMHGRAGHHDAILSYDTILPAVKNANLLHARYGLVISSKVSRYLPASLPTKTAKSFSGGFANLCQGEGIDMQSLSKKQLTLYRQELKHRVAHLMEHNKPPLADILIRQAAEKSLHKAVKVK